MADRSIASKLSRDDFDRLSRAVKARAYGRTICAYTREAVLEKLAREEAAAAPPARVRRKGSA